MPKKYKYAVIGGGVAGYPAAIELARNSHDVVLIEANKLGGECTNYGCIPTKAFIHAVRSYSEASKFSSSEIKFDYQKFFLWRKGIVDRIIDGIRFLLENYGVDVIEGYAQLKNSGGVIEVKTDKGSTEELEAEKVLLAVGSVPIIPEGIVIDGELIHDNRTILELKKMPDSVAILGGGAIGIEYANAFALLGKKVYVIEAMPEILLGIDVDIKRLVVRNLKKLDVEIHTSTTIKEIKKEPNSLSLTLSNGYKLEPDILLVAVGRKPNTNNLGLERAGIEVDEKGFIKVNKQLMTTNPKFYAAGDCTGPPMLAHKGMKQSITAAHNMMGKSESFSGIIPNVIYTTPEIAIARKSLPNPGENIVKTYKLYLTSLSRALIDSAGEGIILLKTIKNNQIAEAAIYAPNAGDLISYFTIAMEKGITLDELDQIIYPHPTMSEAIKESIELALGVPVHVFTKKQPSQ